MNANIPRKPAYWTPSRVALGVALAASIVGVTAIAVSPVVEAQLGSSECQQAATWHRQMGLKWSEKADQEYHAWAAEMADDLAASGGSCSGWQSDSRSPYMAPDGSMRTSA